MRSRRSLPEGFSWGPFQGSIHSELASPGHGDMVRGTADDRDRENDKELSCLKKGVSLGGIFPANPLGIFGFGCPGGFPATRCPRSERSHGQGDGMLPFPSCPLLHMAAGCLVARVSSQRRCGLGFPTKICFWGILVVPGKRWSGTGGSGGHRCWWLCRGGCTWVCFRCQILTFQPHPSPSISPELHKSSSSPGSSRPEDLAQALSPPPPPPSPPVSLALFFFFLHFF